VKTRIFIDQTTDLIIVKIRDDIRESEFISLSLIIICMIPNRECGPKKVVMPRVEYKC
jgi:hypothetical protein